MVFPQVANASSDLTPLDSRLQKSRQENARSLPLGGSGAHLSPTTVSRAAAPASSPPATTSATNSAGTITSSDFLTLLVTELKNQDPTSNQDPNAYINQLVGVNSLQQLISINQELTPATSPTAAASVPAKPSISGEGTHASLLTPLKASAPSLGLALPSSITDAGSLGQSEGSREP